MQLCFTIICQLTCACGYSPAAVDFTESKQGQERERRGLGSAYIREGLSLLQRGGILGYCIYHGVTLAQRRKRSLLWSSFPRCCCRSLSLQRGVNLIYQLCRERPETCVNATYPMLVACVTSCEWHAGVFHTKKNLYYNDFYKIHTFWHPCFSISPCKTVVNC